MPLKHLVRKRRDSTDSENESNFSDSHTVEHTREKPCRQQVCTDVQQVERQQVCADVQQVEKVFVWTVRSRPGPCSSARRERHGTDSLTRVVVVVVVFTFFKQAWSPLSTV